MNRLLTILLLLGATAHGQINNPPTSVNIVDATATGRAVLTATNAAAAATAIGLGTANEGTFNRVQVGGAIITADDFSGGNFVVTSGHALTFASGGTPGATLTNLGLGAADNVTFSNITANGIVTANDSTATPATSAAAAQGIQWPGLGGSQHAAIYGGYAGAAQIALAVGTSNSLSDVATFSATGMTVNSNAIVGGTLGVTGNATLNGVDNLAPSQTASSGSSLMTRDLLFRAQADDNSGDLVAMVGYTTSGGTGAVAAARDVFGASAQVSTNSNSVAGVYFADNIWANSTVSGAVVPSGKTIDLTMKGVNFRNLTNTSYVTRVVAGVGSPFRTIPAAGQDALSARGWGVNFFYNGTNHVFQPFWYTTSYNTGPETVVSNATANDSVFALRLRHEGPTTNGTISFWINDGLASRLSETPSFSTNVGDWGGNFGGRHYAIESATATNAAPASTTSIRVRAAYIKYDP